MKLRHANHDLQPKQKSPASVHKHYAAVAKDIAVLQYTNLNGLLVPKQEQA